MTSSSPSVGTPPREDDVIAMEERHLEQAAQLTKAVGWPARLEDWQTAFELGRGFAVELDGELVGTAIWWPYGSTHGSTGMIIVADSAQRRGIGARLMERLLTDAAGRTIILNSTVAGKKLYERLGFKPYDQVRQHQAVLEAAPEADASVPLRDVTTRDTPAIIALDEAAAGMPRPEMLAKVFSQSESLVVERDGSIAGYGCVRPWGRGVVIGPVIAQDVSDAKALIAALASRHEGEFVRIDVPKSSGLSDWLVEIGLPQTDEVVTMSLGPPPRTSNDATLFALANQSFG
ncbi:GNAT family N-acetyltransferase [Novosphingobium aquimarinum]|uniref:GNAT family N-acetyltransferase n=1 Tax=Novosphingobium aquimarinum TaxID=2682494 RepID=UPI0012EB3BF4|nr:GNAT family N-acetyltransferase [Novosphingobium aquimarinum]